MDQVFSFGYWIRRRRKALDLTQSELAQQVGCAKVTIQKIEADERHPSLDMALHLARVLAIPAGDHGAFLQSARGERAPDRLPAPTAGAGVGGAAPPVSRHQVPSPVTPLIGRTQEVLAIRVLVQQPEVRLVTLTGVGGTGKTRLALHIAAELRADFADGVAFVELAPLSNPDLVAGTIAQALDIPDVTGQNIVAHLSRALHDRQLLLVLDNFEHLLAAGPLVAELLRGAPELTVLVTSRAVLHLSGEHEFPVPPLALPPEGATLDALIKNEAVQLFVARARAVAPGFRLTSANAADVAAICRRLEGLPLALQLAAAHTKLFAPVRLLQRLGHRLSELSGGAHDAPLRQQTLRQTIAWSYDLLAPAERLLFRRMAVFLGGATLAAAEAVCNIDGDLQTDVLTCLQSLVDQSLLQPLASAGGEPRFTMLETLREYALERLMAGGELDSLRARHAGYFRDLAAPVALLLPFSPALKDELLDADYDNLLAVLEWADAMGDTATGLEVTCAMAHTWMRRGTTRERQQWLDAFLARSEAAQPPAGRVGLLRAKVLREAGDLARQLGQLPRAVALLEQSRDLARAHADEHLAAWSIYYLGIATWNLGNHAGSIVLLEEALQLFGTLDDPAGVSSALFSLARLAYARTDPPRATRYLEEALVANRTLDVPGNIGACLQALAEVALLKGDTPRATKLLEESLPSLREGGERRWLAEALHNLTHAVLDAGDWRRATTLLRESLAIERMLDVDAAALRFLEESVGVALVRGQWKQAALLIGAVETASAHARPNTRSIVDAPYVRRVDEARTHLGPTSFAAAYAQGQALSTADAVAYALDEES